MLGESIFLAIITGLLSGKRLISLSTVKIEKYYLVLIAFALEFFCNILINSNMKPYATILIDRFLIIQIIVYSLLFTFFFFNAQNKYLRILFAGILLNFVVIIANNGMMPVDAAMALAHGYSVDKLAEHLVGGHTLLIEGYSKLPILADIINIPPPYPFPKTISIGDILISVGAFLFIYTNMKDS